jgi:hypothetical protein
MEKLEKFILSMAVCIFILSPVVAQAQVWFDEVQYWRILDQKRPELLADPATCYGALTLKSALRSRLLDGTETPQQIINENYSTAEKNLDFAWMQGQQAALVAKGAELLSLLSKAGIDVRGISPSDPSNQLFRRAMAKGINQRIFVYAPAGYVPSSFVGYEVGTGNVADERGLDYKVFFEFADYHTDLTPAVYQKFSQALAKAGFHGDSKTPTFSPLPGQNRFQYNNLIVHSHSIADAKIAEWVGFEVFGRTIAHMSRGVDVMRKVDGSYVIPGLNQAYDWHHFLCSRNFIYLPVDVKEFVETAPM